MIIIISEYDYIVPFSQNLLRNEVTLDIPDVQTHTIRAMTLLLYRGYIRLYMQVNFILKGVELG